MLGCKGFGVRIRVAFLKAGILVCCKQQGSCGCGNFLVDVLAVDGLVTPQGLQANWGGGPEVGSPRKLKARVLVARMSVNIQIAFS